MEIHGRHATPVGLVEDVHLFTTAGFVLTDLENGWAFLDVPDSHVTYIVCKCRPGADVAVVARNLRGDFPEHHVLTAQAFHDRASSYWSNRTSIGPVLLLSSVLAVMVGFLIVMLTFYISTVEKIPIFACMKALGASGGEVASIMIFQVLIVFVLGCAMAGVGLYVTLMVLARTTISVVITEQLVLAGIGTTGLCSSLSSLLSIRKMISTGSGEALTTCTLQNVILGLHDVDKQFLEPQGVLQVLKKLRLTVRRGEIVMVTGPSGSGKTTLLQICGCLIRPTEGGVELAGIEVSRSSEAERRRLGDVIWDSSSRTSTSWPCCRSL